MYVLSRLVHGWKTSSDAGLRGGDILAISALLNAYDAASGWPLTPVELRALPFEMARAPLFPIVAAGADAVEETLRFAPHLTVARWLVDHADEVALAFQDSR